MPKVFSPNELQKLYVPPTNSSGEDNGQVTIIGGSELFHGAPLLALTPASQIVDMVFFSSPFKPEESIVNNIKSKLFSFIWVPWRDIEKYIEKSDTILMGPGFMRYASERTKRGRVFDATGRRTRRITEYLLKEFPRKKWVIDAGSLQTMDPTWIPSNAIITPNRKEFEMLFHVELKDSIKDSLDVVEKVASDYKCIVVLKGPETVVTNGRETVFVEGGNAGLTKGGTGDVLAGLTVALLAKNDPMLAATCASYLIKKTADELYKIVGTHFNADDVSAYIPQTFHKLQTK